MAENVKIAGVCQHRIQDPPDIPGARSLFANLIPGEETGVSLILNEYTSLDFIGYILVDL